MSVLDLIRPELQTITSYNTPGNELNCRLHNNELPWSPLEVADGNLNRYPDKKKQLGLQQWLAENYRVSPSQLLLTRGSDDGIDLLMRLFLSEGKNSILQCTPTFPMYAFYARLQRARILDCPLNEADGFTLSIDALFSTWEPDCKLIMLCRPNNPTGNLLDLATIATICNQYKNRSMVVVDEAYIEFSGADSATILLSKFDNLIILRTLSKAYGLAGLRLGCVMSGESIINALKNIMPPYTLSSPVMALANQALTDKAWFASSINKIIASRERLLIQLKQIPVIDRVFDSFGNFVLIKSQKARELANCFAENGIAIRSFADPGPLASMLRFSIGDESQHLRLLALLDRRHCEEHSDEAIQ